MNKRIKKKRWLELNLAQCLARERVVMRVVTDQNDRIQELETANHLQQETIEKLGDELATVKRELASLERVVKANAEATNNRLDDQDGKIKKVADDLVIRTAKKGFWKK